MSVASEASTIKNHDDQETDDFDINTRLSLYLAGDVSDISASEALRLELYCPREKYIGPLEALLRFCYTKEYMVPDEHELNWHLYVHHLAQTYKIEELQQIAASNYEESMFAWCQKANEETVADHFKRAFTQHAPDQCSDQLHKNVNLIEFRRMVKSLDSTGRSDQAMRRMYDNPRAATMMFNMALPQQQRITPYDHWKCACGKTYLYIGERKDKGLKLPVCPCCVAKKGGRLTLKTQPECVVLDD